MSLVIAGLLGIGFFWLTDPRYGAFPQRSASAGDNVIDAMRHASTGTFIGVAGSALVLLIGLWLMTRRAT